MNSQPDNNQEKLIQAESLFPTRQLFWELAATCSVLGLERDASLFPRDTRCWDGGGGVQAARSQRWGGFGIARAPSLAGGWGSRHGMEPWEIKQPRVSQAPLPPRAPRSGCPRNPAPNPLAGMRRGEAGCREPHPHRCFPARSLCAFICPSINFRLALNHSRS